MKRIHELALQNVITVLGTLGVAYRIRLQDGTEYSKGFDAPPEPVATKKPRRIRQNRRHLYVPHLEGIQVGESRMVPAQNEMRSGELGLCITLWMKRRFGEQGFIVAANKDGSHEVMRVA